MTSRKKTWAEKLADKDGLPKCLSLEKRFPCYNAVHKMGADVGDEIVLVNPSEVVALMKKVPRGRLVTIVEICRSLARKHGVRGCCSLTAGIFIMTAANAAAEAATVQKDMGIPYWRTLKADGGLNDKYPGGSQAHKALLEAEGFKITRKGKKYFVDNYHGFLVNDL